MAGGARTQILIAAVLFGTTGTAQAVGPELDPLAVGASRIAVGGALLGLFALATAAAGRVRLRTGGGPRPGLFARTFTGERLTLRWAAATALACAGVVLLVLGGGGASGAVSAPGVGLALVA